MTAVAREPVPVAVRDRRVADGAHLVGTVARRYFRRCSSWPDLLAAGQLGLVEAAARYPVGGSYFEPYAAQCIRFHVARAARRDRSVLHVPHGIGRRLEVAGATARHARFEAEARAALRRATMSPWGTWDATATERAGAAPSADPVEAADEAASLLTVLDDRERAVIARRFGLDGHPEMDAAGIAADLGISMGWVSRITARALEKMKARAIEIDPGATLACVRTDGTTPIVGNDDIIRMVARRLSEGQSVAATGRELGISSASVRKAREVARARGLIE